MFFSGSNTMTYLALVALSPPPPRNVANPQKKTKQTTQCFSGSSYTHSWKNSLCTILWKTAAAGESGSWFRKDLPSSQLRAILGSSGTFPSSGRFKSAHIRSAPPLVGGKIWDVFYNNNKKKMQLSITFSMCGSINLYLLSIY